MNRKVIAEFLEKYDFWYKNDKNNIQFGLGCSFKDGIY